MAKKNISLISKRAETERKKKKPVVVAEKVEKPKKKKKIKQTFVDDGNFQTSDTLVLRLVKDGIPIEECIRKYKTDITRNSNKIGALCVFKKDVLCSIEQVIKDEKHLVYVVKEVDEETRKKYLATFGHIDIKSYFQTSCEYKKLK